MFNRFGFGVLAASLALSGCAGELSDDFFADSGVVPRSDSGTGTNNPTDSGTGNASDTGMAAEPDSGPSVDVEALVQSRCAKSGCHDGSIPPDLSGGLDGMTATSGCDGIPYVTPGDADNSLVFLRADSSSDAPCGGGVMPPTFDSDPLDSDQIDAMRAYINSLGN